jgi:hypothetical protein
MLLALFVTAYLLHPVITSNDSPACFFRIVTGRQCPFCGLTRAFSSAARGDFSGASLFHPLWWLAALSISAAGIACLYDAITGRGLIDRALRHQNIFVWPLLVLFFVTFLIRLIA